MVSPSAPENVQIGSCEVVTACHDERANRPSRKPCGFHFRNIEANAIKRSENSIGNTFDILASHFLVCLLLLRFSIRNTARACGSNSTPRNSVLLYGCTHRLGIALPFVTGTCSGKTPAKLLPRSRSKMNRQFHGSKPVSVMVVKQMAWLSAIAPRNTIQRAKI
jgi:hypothetical protein